MKYEIPQDLLAAILQYLAGRPYAEVVQLINGIQALQPTEKPDLKST